MASLPELRYFNTGEVAIHCAEYAPEAYAIGNNLPPYVFIHGITGRHETWDEIIGSIRQGARAIAIDLRGHGRSGHTTGSYLLQDYSRDVAALISGLKLTECTVVGHSLGAMTAIQLASDAPASVRAIVLEDPPLFARPIMEEVAPERHERFGNNAALSASGMTREQMAQQIRQVNPDMPDEDVQKAALQLFVTDSDAIAHVHDERIDWTDEIESIMQSVQCPVLLIQGSFELGAWMRDTDGVRAKSLFKDCVLEIWNDTGHSLHSEHPNRFIAQVNDFVSNLSPEDGRR